jgi:hypothetical protein
VAELGGLVSGERLACSSESCGPLPDLGASANAPRLGSVASSLPSGVCRSPRKVRLLRRALIRRPRLGGSPFGLRLRLRPKSLRPSAFLRRLRPVAAGARASQAAFDSVAASRLPHPCGAAYRQSMSAPASRFHSGPRSARPPPPGAAQPPRCRSSAPAPRPGHKVTAEPRAAAAKAQNQLRDDELRAEAALFVAARGEPCEVSPSALAASNSNLWVVLWYAGIPEIMITRRVRQTFLKNNPRATK